MEFPVCYILLFKSHNVYVSNSKGTYAKYPDVVEALMKGDDSKLYFYTSDIEMAKRWSSYKKVKTWLGKDATVRSAYYVVGSDQTVIPATDLESHIK